MAKKVLDKKNRWRNKTVSFRMSPEEANQLDVLAKLSGLSKQDYIISRLLCRDIIVFGNSRIYKILRDNMIKIYEQLKQVEPDSDVLETLQVIAITLNGFKENGKELE